VHTSTGVSVVVGATVVVVVAGTQLRLFEPVQTSTGVSVVVGATVVVVVGALVVVVAGTQLRLFEPVHTSTGASVVVGAAVVVVVVVTSVLRLAANATAINANATNNARVILLMLFVFCCQAS
jgi:hypothetical protein